MNKNYHGYAQAANNAGKVLVDAALFYREVADKIKSYDGKVINKRIVDALNNSTGGYAHVEQLFYQNKDKCLSISPGLYTHYFDVPGKHPQHVYHGLDCRIARYNQGERLEAEYARSALLDKAEAFELEAEALFRVSGEYIEGCFRTIENHVNAINDIVNGMPFELRNILSASSVHTFDIIG